MYNKYPPVYISGILKAIVVQEIMICNFINKSIIRIRTKKVLKSDDKTQMFFYHNYIVVHIGFKTSNVTHVWNFNCQGAYYAASPDYVTLTAKSVRFYHKSS